MTAVTVSEAHTRLSDLVAEVARSHYPVTIVGDEGNAVLISEADWASICETLAISSIPGAVEAIREGMATPIKSLPTEVEW